MQSEMINSIFALMDAEIGPPEVDFMVRQHGKVVKRTFSAYHDETIYEDGYVDRDYIGD